MWLIVVLNLLTGRWDIKEIQDINYITAIGIDQQDGNFVVYTQMMDFTSVAKIDSGKSDKPSQIWTSKTKGKPWTWRSITFMTLRRNVRFGVIFPVLSLVITY